MLQLQSKVDIFYAVEMRLGSHFGIVPWVGLLVCTVACGGGLPPRASSGLAQFEVVDETRPIEVKGLPSGGRVLLRSGWTTDLVLSEKAARQELRFSYRKAVARDGFHHFERAVPRTLHLEVHAPGYFSKRIDVTIPGTTSIDASLRLAPATAPACEPGTFPETPEPVERAYELELMARYSEAQAILQEAYESSKQPELLVEIGYCQLRLRDTESAARSFSAFVTACPRSLALDEISALAERKTSTDMADGHAPETESEDPDELASRLSLKLSRIDRKRAKVAERVIERAAAGRTRDATRLAQAIADGLDPESAGSLLRLPRLFLGQRWVSLAADAIEKRSPSRALALLDDARLLTPALVDRSHLRERAIALRATQLAARSRATLSEDAVLSAAYFIGWRALLKRDVPLPLALELALREASASTLAVRDGTDSGWPRGALFHQRLLAQLQSRLPAHATLRDGGDEAEWELAVSLTYPKRALQGSVQIHTKSVVAYSYQKPNPAWTAAAAAYNQAIERCGQARQEYAQLHQAAQELAQKADSSALGIFAGVTSGMGEGAALGIVISSQTALKNASHALASTPQSITERVMGNAKYPVEVLSAHVTSVLGFRLAGPGKSVEDSDTLAADAQAEIISAVPELEIAEQDTGSAALGTLEPDYDAGITRLLDKIAPVLVEAEEARLWADVTRAREKNDEGERAAAYAVYLQAGSDAAHRAEALEYLTWMLQ